MKVRSGFVSNSSSSSFILVFDKKPETKEELSELMGDCSVSSWDDHVLSSDEVVDIAFNDILEAGEASTHVIESLISGDDYDWEAGFRLNYDSKEYKEWEEKEKARNMATAKKFIEDKKGKYITIVEYDDDTTRGSMMEHGGAFDNIDHVRISHH